MGVWRHVVFESVAVCIRFGGAICHCSNKGKLELVDVSSALPGLIRRPGITKWVPCEMSYGKMCELEANTTDKQVRSLSGASIDSESIAGVAVAHWQDA